MWSVIKKIIMWMVSGVPAFLVGGTLLIYLGLPDVSDLMTNNPRTSALMLQRFREAKQAQSNLIIRQRWVSFDEISTLFKDTIRVTEDAGFYQHQGVDLTELKAGKFGGKSKEMLVKLIMGYRFQVSGVRNMQRPS
jgi:membrane peptidoglycan carboxypeptidase